MASEHYLSITTHDEGGDGWRPSAPWQCGSAARRKASQGHARSGQAAQDGVGCSTAVAGVRVSGQLVWKSWRHHVSIALLARCAPPTLSLGSEHGREAYASVAGGKLSWHVWCRWRLAVRFSPVTAQSAQSPRGSGTALGRRL